MSIFLVSASAILIVSILVFYFSVLGAKKIRRYKQRQGLALMKYLRNYLAKIQKHRGLSSGYLSGDASLLGDIEMLQRGILEDAEAIKNVGEWVPENERWQNIGDHWARLSKSFKDNEIANNMNQHNMMIQNILYLIEDMADEHMLIHLQNEIHCEIEFLWKDVLHMIESMGQARAIGTSVAAKGKCGSVDRIKLNYLHKKIEQGAVVVQKDLPRSSQVSESVKSLLDCIDAKILRAKCTIKPNEYFNTATQALESMYEEYDHTLSQLHSQI